jgi:hypothetical protein
MANSIGSMKLGDGQGPYFIVGTAYIEPQELEPSKVLPSNGTLMLLCHFAICDQLYRDKYSYFNNPACRVAS